MRLTEKVNSNLDPCICSVAVFLREPDGAIGAAGLCPLVVSASIMPSSRKLPLVYCKKMLANCMADFYEQNRQRGRVESSTGAMYSAPPPVPPPPRPTLLLPLLCCTGSRVETEGAAVGQETGELCSGSKQGMGRWRSNKGPVLFVGKGGRKGRKRGIEWSGGVEKARDVSRGQQGVLLISISFF